MPEGACAAWSVTTMADLDERLRARGEAWRSAQPPAQPDAIDRAVVRRPRRPMALALVAGSILLIVIGAVVLAGRDDDNSLTVTQSTPSEPEATQPPARTCTAAQLDIGFPGGAGAAAGTSYFTAPIRNTGAPCTLSVVAVGLSALDASGKRVYLDVGFEGAPPEATTLPSGAAGALSIGTANVCADGGVQSQLPSHHFSSVEVSIQGPETNYLITALTGLALDLCDTSVTVFIRYPAEPPSQTFLSTRLKDAVAKVTGDGWIAREAERTFTDNGLSVIKGVAQSVSGRGVRFYFFVNGQFTGTDGDGSQDAYVVSNDGTTIAIRYVLYKSTDPGCCPTGGEAVVRFEQHGDAVVAIDPLPGRWPETEPVGR
jgi:hypothetical protein